jgi:hypothetical protein
VIGQALPRRFTTCAISELLHFNSLNSVLEDSWIWRHVEDVCKAWFGPTCAWGVKCWDEQAAGSGLAGRTELDNP